MEVTRRRAWLVSLMVLVGALLPVVAPQPSSAACAGPSLAASPASVGRGREFRVSGGPFSDRCNDVLFGGRGGCESPRAAALPVRGIDLVLRSGSWERSAAVVDGYTFDVVITVPDDAPLGDGEVVARVNGFDWARTAITITSDDTSLEQRPVSIPPQVPADGYLLAAADGGVFAFGDREFHGSAAGQVLAAPVVDVASTEARDGYWLAAADGGVFSFGAAPFHGAGSNIDDCAIPTVGAVTAAAGASDGTDGGYWTATERGLVFAFSAPYHGSLFPELPGGAVLTPSAPIVDIDEHRSRYGYWLVGADGGVFSFGEATFHGSLANVQLNAPTVGMASTIDGDGYWLAAADGGVFAFGDAEFLGSMASTALAAPIVGIAPTSSGHGYWLVAADGGVFAFGDAPFLGSMGGKSLAAPVVGIT